MVYFFSYILQYVNVYLLSFLFLIERGTESDKTTFFWKKASRLGSYNPSISVTSGPSPIPAMYRATETIAKSTGSVASAASAAAVSAVSAASTAKSSISSMSTSTAKKVKRSFFKSIGEGIVNFFISLGNIIVFPFKSIVRFFDRKLKPTKENETTESKSLIEEYMKEYKQKKV